MSEEDQDKEQKVLDQMADELGEHPAECVDDIADTGTVPEGADPILASLTVALLTLATVHTGGVYHPALIHYANEGREVKYSQAHGAESFGALVALLIAGDEASETGIHVNGIRSAILAIDKAKEKEERKEAEKEAARKAKEEAKRKPKSKEDA